ncbi:MAG: SDR family NAD(P)-dependent oxidoreductase [Acidimicrobiia bacterium]
MARFPFRSALVTGASSGIGEAGARLLAEDGVSLVVVARRGDRLDALAAEYADVEALAADLTTPAGVAAVVARLEDRARPLDLLVNNAGFGSSGDFVSIDADRLDDEITLNVATLTRLSRAALPPMIERGRGWLLNVSSVASFQPIPQLAVYAATKAFVTSLTESLHEELRGTGVSATALCPGLTRTEFQSVSSTESYSTRYPGLAWMSADYVARAGLNDCARRRAISVPGPLYKGLVTSTQFVPRGIVRRAAGIATRWGK